MSALEDGVVRLRRWTDADVPRLVALCSSSPDIPRFTRVPSPYTPEDARMFLALAELERRDGRAQRFAITRVAGGEDRPVGSLALQNVAEGQAEAGYFLAPEARGAGLATRALVLIAEWAFAALGLDRVELHAAIENRPSQAVAERAGFAREGVVRDVPLGPDRRLDCVRYARQP